MKKIVFALIAVLLLGTFVACDGEADFLLWEDEPAGPKTLKLKLDYDDFSFEGGYDFVGAIELPVDDSVETWADLINHSFEIPLFQLWSGVYEESLIEWDNYSDYVDLNGSGFGVRVVLDGDLLKTDPIHFDSQYLLTFNM